MRPFWVERSLSKAEALGWFEEWKTQQRERGFSTWIISLQENGTDLGFIGLGPLAAIPGEIEIFRIFPQEHWGQGYGTMAGRRTFQQGFSQFGLKQIYSSIHPDNHGSIRVAEKSGMTFVEYHPQTNRNLYLITSEEFNTR